MASRYTGAYSRFTDRLTEIETLLSVAKRTERATITGARPSDLALVRALCRSAIVLLSSHIEGYVEDLGEVIIDRIASRQLAKSVVGAGFRYYLSRDLIKQIKDTHEPSDIARRVDRLFSRDGHLWDHTLNFVPTLNGAVFVSDFDNPTHKRVCQFIRRFGYDSFDHDLRVRLQVNYAACTNMINQVVDQRNKIAHGDVTMTSTPADVSAMIEWVKLYCREADCATADWFRNKGCPIR